MRGLTLDILSGLATIAVFLIVVVVSAISVNPIAQATQISCFGGMVEYHVEQPISRGENYISWATDTEEVIIYDKAQCSVKEE